MKIASHAAMLEISAAVMGTPAVIYPALLFDSDTLLLVDSGYPNQLNPIREAVEKEGESFDRLDGIILTHQDIDHIGSAASICRALPGRVTVYAHEAEKPYINGEKTPLKLAQLEANPAALPEKMKAVYPMLKAGFQASFTEVHTALRDGDVLPACGGIEVIWTPGHTLGHICLYLRESKTLIAGDALAVEEGRLAVTPASINHDSGLYRDSLRKLAQYDIERVVCYHGGLYQGDCTRRIAALAAG